MHAVCFLWERRDGSLSGSFNSHLQKPYPAIFNHILLKNTHESCCCNVKQAIKTDTGTPSPPLPSPPLPWPMWFWLCVAERSWPQRYAALRRCSGSIHQCPTTWQAEQCSTSRRCDGSTAQTLTPGSQRAARLVLTMTPSKITHILLPTRQHGRRTISELQEPICEQESGLNVTKEKKYLSHAQQDCKGFIHYPVAQGYQNKSAT